MCSAAPLGGDRLEFTPGIISVKGSKKEFFKKFLPVFTAGKKRYNRPMPEIKILDASLINKIAAGEVIERPASVVKELVENSLDAGAKKIEIDIEKAGSDLIRISDDGCGMRPEQLRLALAQHATSKISVTDDLFHIGSFGFRGEALASIAEVSQLVIKSCSDEAPHGAELRVEGGAAQSEPVPCGMRRGTTIEVRNLFFNTPVRRKFLKGTITEFGHISEAVARLAIPNTDVHFILRHNGRVVYDLPPCAGIRDRVSRIFGDEFAAKLIPIETNGEGVRVSGYIGHPDLTRSNYSCQYFFLNRRYIRDKSLQHALVQAYRGLLMVGRYPVAFLEIKIDPSQVDVNVHPTKMEVRFLESNRVYAALLSAIRNEFLRTDIRSRPAADLIEVAERNSPQNALDPAVAEDIRESFLDWSGPSPEGRKAPTPDASVYLRPSPAFASSAPPRERASDDFRPYPELSPSGFGFEKPRPVPQESAEFTAEEADSRSEPNESSDTAFTAGDAEPIPRTPDGKPVIQIHDCFLVFETETGMALVDQHALHERILYEKIRAAYKNVGKLDSQRLLVPEPIDLTPEELACVLDNRETLAGFGILVEEFGGNTVLLSGYPRVLEKSPPKEIFVEVLGILMKRGKENIELEDLLDDILRTCACRAAVKEGDRLSGDAMRELLAQAQQEINAHHCPHGRPSILLLSVQELEKMFKRT